MMIGLEPAVEMMRIIYHASFVEGENPLGLLLVAPPGAGKSHLLTRFEGKRYLVFSDITGFGTELLFMQMQELERGFIAIPDLVRVLSRKNYKSLFAVFNILLEEGVKGISRKDFQIEFEKPVRFGLAAAITNEEFAKRKKLLKSIGFYSRVIHFQFTYNIDDMHRVQEQILIGADRKNSIVKLPEIEPASAYISDKMVIKKAGKIANFLTRMKGEHFPFRATKIIRRLLKGSALSEGRNEVNMEDLAKVFALVPYIVFDVFSSLAYKILYEMIPEDGIEKDLLIEELSEEYSNYTIERELKLLLNNHFIKEEVVEKKDKKVVKLYNPIFKEE